MLAVLGSVLVLTTIACLGLLRALLGDELPLHRHVRFVLRVLVRPLVRCCHDDWSRDEKAAWSRSMSGALIGFAGAIGALGGVFINVALRASQVSAAKSATNAFWVFSASM